MAGNTDDMPRELRQVIQNEKVCARFTPDELEYIRAVEQQYSQTQIDKLISKFDIVIRLDGGEECFDEMEHDYYVKLLKLPLKKRKR